MTTISNIVSMMDATTEPKQPSWFEKKPNMAPIPQYATLLMGR
jgi:hypothetical protein